VSPIPRRAPSLDLSVVLPIYNELDNIRPLVADIQAAIPTDVRYEIICVDDCSTDGSGPLLAELAKSEPTVRHIRHRRNFGQSASVATGFAAAAGCLLLTMDSDRQNEPSDIPAFLKAMQEGVDCVCGIRQKRQDSALKLLSSKLANGFRRFILRDSIHDAGCGFRILRRECVGNLPVFNGLHRFIPIILSRQGGVVREIEISHRERSAGVSKYGVNNRLWRGLFDCFGVWWYCRRAVPFRRVGDEQSKGEAS
jgi:dolichol-phosphate mannosyltransferase